MKTAWLFPGQGSQAIAMGSDLYNLPEAQAKLQQAEQNLGWSVPEICNSLDDKVSKTLYTQPCLYTIEAILADLMRNRKQKPSLIAGHSLGEYIALYAAGVFDFESGLRLVKRRAELMDRETDGVMTALLGFDRHQLEQAIAQTANVVLANDNSAEQVVVSGTRDGVQNLISKVKPKNAIKLNVSGPFHSPLMKNAADEFQKVLDKVNFQTAQVPVLPNMQPTPIKDANILKDCLSRQMTGSVRWQEITLQLLKAGIERIVEIGPSKVLTGIIKRNYPDLVLENVGSFSQISSLCDDT